MSKGRVEAFSDGVLAIIITIMVLELQAPESAEPAALLPLIPVFASYLLSFVFIGIYWNNHHHMFQSVHKVNGAVLWTNLHLLFWLSLVPFSTSWMGESGFSSGPVAIYGVVLWMAGLAYYFLVRALLAIHPKDSPLAVAVGNNIKEILSLAFYTIAIPLAFFSTLAASIFYVLVAVMWFIPDRRFENLMK